MRDPTGQGHDRIGKRRGDDPAASEEQIRDRGEVDLVGLDAALAVDPSLHRHVARVEHPQLPAHWQDAAGEGQVVVTGRLQPDAHQRDRRRRASPNPFDQNLHTAAIERKLEGLGQLGASEVDDLGHRLVLADIDRDRHQVLEPNTGRARRNRLSRREHEHLQGCQEERRCSAEPSS